MPDIASLVGRLGGVAHKHELLALGARDHQLSEAIRSGRVTRPRRGWYCTLPASDPVFRAVRVGGRLTGLSLVRAMDGWVLKPGPLHVSVPANSSRLRSQVNRNVRINAAEKHGTVLHWDNEGVATGGTKTAVTLEDALIRVILDEELEVAVAALDWALYTGELHWPDLVRLVARLPSDRRWIQHWIDPACESFPESLARTRLRVRGYRVRSQVVIRQRRRQPSRRIDLLVEDQVALEVDGKAYHADRFEPDRRKDLLITRHGLHALRPTASMIFDEWEDVLAAIDAALARLDALPSSGKVRRPATIQERHPLESLQAG